MEKYQADFYPELRIRFGFELAPNPKKKEKKKTKKNMIRIRTDKIPEQVSLYVQDIVTHFIY